MGAIVAPKLKKFAIETGGLDVGALKSIGAANWPEIEDIEVWLGQDQYGWNGKPKDVLPLLQRTDLTKLRRLALKNNELHEVIAGYILNAALLPQLTELDLSMSTLDDAVGEQFIANAHKLSHLKVLNLSDCYLSKPMVKRLKAALPQVAVSGQREPDDWGDALHRYSSVGE